MALSISTLRLRDLLISNDFHVVQYSLPHRTSLLRPRSSPPSGKTTQLPQFLLDDWRDDASPKIIVTQPRRIAALSVAERVSWERREKIGQTAPRPEGPKETGTRRYEMENESDVDVVRTCVSLFNFVLVFM